MIVVEYTAVDTRGEDVVCGAWLERPDVEARVCSDTRLRDDPCSSRDNSEDEEDEEEEDEELELELELELVDGEEDALELRPRPRLSAAELLLRDDDSVLTLPMITYPYTPLPPQTSS